MNLFQSGGSGGAAGSLTKLSNTVVGVGGLALVTINVSGVYDSLLVLWEAKSDVNAVGADIQVIFNGDSAVHYLWQAVQVQNNTLTGRGSAASANIFLGPVSGATSPAGSIARGRITIPFAFESTYHKGLEFATSGLQEETDAFGVMYYAGMGVWKSAAALTSLGFSVDAGNIAQGSQFDVYGLT